MPENNNAHLHTYYHWREYKWVDLMNSDTVFCSSQGSPWSCLSQGKLGSGNDWNQIWRLVHVYVQGTCFLQSYLRRSTWWMHVIKVLEVFCHDFSCMEMRAVPHLNMKRVLTFGLFVLHVSDHIWSHGTGNWSWRWCPKGRGAMCYCTPGGKLMEM